MRALLMLAMIASCGDLLGCKTAEIAVDHQLTGIHVVAKFEGKDEVVASDDGELRVGERRDFVTR
ncbi:hypothetical protein [Lacipirellula limnantheis]|uniref:Uncharacterized protein n=1 Tax=Lacipirellula limnantheis TaxID=2528024 RepID=A0A517TT48_9BACT|nr:hypothetical protein [Lacipirellula limnantheis]QDT71546.1 hypothetical protein I41_07050 [Lacipirellula limnantheis]